MDESHASYWACGLGSDGTDRLVEMVARRGSPSAGCSARRSPVVGAAGRSRCSGTEEAEPAVREIARAYGAESGARAERVRAIADRDADGARGAGGCQASPPFAMAQGESRRGCWRPSEQSTTACNDEGPRRITEPCPSADFRLTRTQVLIGRSWCGADSGLDRAAEGGDALVGVVVGARERDAAGAGDQGEAVQVGRAVLRLDRDGVERVVGHRCRSGDAGGERGTRSPVPRPDGTRTRCARRGRRAASPGRRRPSLPHGG